MFSWHHPGADKWGITVSVFKQFMWEGERPTARIISMIIFKQNCSLLQIRAHSLCQLHLHVFMAHNQVMSWQYLHLCMYSMWVAKLFLVCTGFIIYCEWLCHLYSETWIHTYVLPFQAVEKRRSFTLSLQRESCMHWLVPAARGSWRRATATLTKGDELTMKKANSTGVDAAITSTMGSNLPKPSLMPKRELSGMLGLSWTSTTTAAAEQ